MLEKLTAFSMDRPWTTIAIFSFLTILFGLQFASIVVDADPENMLEADQSDRVFYDQTKKEFGINDLIVVGADK